MFSLLSRSKNNTHNILTLLNGWKWLYNKGKQIRCRIILHVFLLSKLYFKLKFRLFKHFVPQEIPYLLENSINSSFYKTKKKQKKWWYMKLCTFLQVNVGTTRIIQIKCSWPISEIVNNQNDILILNVLDAATSNLYPFHAVLEEHSCDSSMNSLHNS